MANSLLPPNRTPLERAAEQTTARISYVNAPFETLWDAWACPLHLLPWLAWALGVREWSAKWSENRQRQAVASAIAVRRHAGTVGAVQEALKASAVENVTLREWFEYAGTPGHFKLEADLSGAGMSADEYRQLIQFVQRAKRLSAHWDGIHLQSSTRGNVRIAATTASGSSLSLRPHQPSSLQTQGTVSLGCASVVGHHLTLRPQQPQRLTSTTLAWLATGSQSSSHTTLFPG